MQAIVERKFRNGTSGGYVTADMFVVRLGVLIGIGASRAFTCSCSLFSPCDLIHLPTVFIGEVIDGGITSIQDDPWRSPVNRVRFKVLERFRGVPEDVKTVEIELQTVAWNVFADPILFRSTVPRGAK